MNLVVDTSVWSLVLRHPRVDDDHPCVQTFRSHILQEHGIFLLGNILQELLDGVKSRQSFDRLVTRLKPFPLLPLDREMYIDAARLRATCRSKGRQAGPVDFLIAAACIHYGYPLLTADRDFSHIAKHSSLLLLPTAASSSKS